MLRSSKNVRHLLGLFLAAGVLAGCGPITQGGIPTCGIYDTSRGTAFCETPAEVALHEKPVHIATIPDALFILNNQSLTVAPSDTSRPTFPEENARSRVAGVVSTYPSLPAGASVGTGTLAELHSKDGTPARGTLVWVFPVHVVSLPSTPSSGAGSAGGAVQHVWAIVNATSGTLIGIYSA